MPWINPTTPNVTDYTSFLRTEIGVSTTVLPDTSNWIPLTLSVAVATVNPDLQSAGATAANPSTGLVSVSLYVLAVYNLAADRLFNFAIDVQNQTYFTDLRSQWKLLEPTLGVVSSASDQGTSGSYVNPEQLHRLTLSQLQNLRTPMGRVYLGIAQAYGPTLWGVS